MRNLILNSLQMVSVVMGLALAGQTAAAGRFAVHEAIAAHTTGRTQNETPIEVRNDELPIEGVLILVGVVGVIVFLAWVCSRVGDNSSVSTPS